MGISVSQNTSWMTENFFVKTAFKNTSSHVKMMHSKRGEH